MPVLEFSGFDEFQKCLALIDELVSSVSVLSPCAGCFMDEANSVLSGIAMLATVAASAKSLPCEILLRNGKQQIHNHSL